MAHILHGTWLPQRGRFFLWGETSDPLRRRGRQTTPPSHPYQLPPDRLRLLMEQVQPRLADGLTEQRQTLWLPSVEHSPCPSPELLATGAVSPVEGTAHLAAWQIHGVLLAATDAVDFLLALADRRDRGADLRAWQTAARLALELLAAQGVMPTLTRDGFSLRAAWRPRPNRATGEKLAVLARSLPPLARAAVTDPAQALAPRALLDSFLAGAVDGMVRDMGVVTRLAGSTLGGKWLAALLGNDPVVKVKGAEADALYKSWQAWSQQARVAGDETFRITFRLEPPPTEDRPWTLAYLLQAADDPSLLVPVAHIWRETGESFTYLARRFDQPQDRLLTALGYAGRLFPPLFTSLRQPAPDHVDLSTAEAFTFLKEAAPLLESSGFGVLVPAWWQGRGARLQARAHIKAASPPPGKSLLNFENLVNFEWETTLGDQPISREEFERLAALKVPLVQVRGQWVVLDPAHLQQALAFFQQRQGQMSLGEALQLGLGGVEEGAPQGVEVTGITADGWLAELLDQLSESRPLDLLPPPAGLNGQLRPYQARGFSWLAFMRQVGLGACLADDMGLGKTAQTIALLLHEREAVGVAAPVLVVCPTSVVGNWRRELERFAPGLNVLTHRGATRMQGDDFLRLAVQHDVVLTSYPLLARDRETLTGVPWATVVLDEAQNIKNASTKQAQAARALPGRTRVALTGTPVENRLSELWSIMSFLNPGYLGSEAAFQREFARPIERTGDPQAAERLRRLTKPFILRRLKTDRAIISDLPDKLEMKVYCPLTQEQASLYEAVVQDALQQIADAEGDPMQRRGLVLAMLMKLKQICNHPRQFLKDGSAIAERSGKLARLTEMLEEVYAEGDRALVFTQFAEMGHLLQEHLAQTFYDDVLFLHGGTPAKERDRLIQRFQAPQGPGVFILSLKAGGTGLNLTRANHVFHYDRWWNPAVENQATDRAFRIGQTQRVQVHKYICGGTLEDHIDQLIEGKRALAESVLGAGEGWLTELSTDELRDLVRLRAEVSDT